MQLYLYKKVVEIQMHNIYDILCFNIMTNRKMFNTLFTNKHTLLVK